MQKALKKDLRKQRHSFRASLHCLLQGCSCLLVLFPKSDTVAQKPLFVATVSPFLHIKILLLLFHYVWIFHFLDYLSHYYHSIPTMQDLVFFGEEGIPLLSFSTHKPNMILEHSAFTALKPLIPSMDIKES